MGVLRALMPPCLGQDACRTRSASSTIESISSGPSRRARSLWSAPSITTTRVGPAAAAATARLCSGGTIESLVPYTTTVRTRTCASSSALLKDRYPVAELLAHVRVRTVVVYGTRDSIVPPEQSRAVAAAAAGPTRVVVIEGADHNDRALLDGPELIDSIVELADRVRQAS